MKVSLVFLLLETVSCLTITPNVTDNLIHSMRSKVGLLLNDLVSFWSTHGPDVAHGGFYGYHNINGTPSPSADKGLTQQCRHLWTFSTLASSSSDMFSESQKQQFRGLSHSLFDFVKKFYLSKEQYFAFQVNYDGSRVTDPSLQIYANSFAIYGLSKYAELTGNQEAVQLATTTLKTLITTFYDDAYGGFDQTFDTWYFTESQKKNGFIKDFKSHLHVLEAMTALYRVTKDSDIQLKINQILDLFFDKMISTRDYIPGVFTKNWTAQPEDIVGYGYDNVASWLLYDSMETVGRSENQTLVQSLVQLANYSVTAGYDPDHGGFFYEGLRSGGVTSDKKMWWVQAESLLALWRLYGWTRDKHYLSQMEKTLDWIQLYQRKTDVGEWYWETFADGRPDLRQNNLIANTWKASYHNGRAMINLMEWLT